MFSDPGGEFGPPTDKVTRSQVLALSLFTPFGNGTIKGDVKLIFSRSVLGGKAEGLLAWRVSGVNVPEYDQVLLGPYPINLGASQQLPNVA